MILATLFEGTEMLETVIASVMAGIGVTTAFSVAIWGVARFIDLSNDGERRLAAAGAAAVAATGLACVAAALVFGIIVMIGH